MLTAERMDVGVGAQPRPRSATLMFIWIYVHVSRGRVRLKQNKAPSLTAPFFCNIYLHHTAAEYSVTLHRRPVQTKTAMNIYWMVVSSFLSFSLCPEESHDARKQILSR